MGAAAAGAHSPRECGSALARRRRQFADPGYPRAGHTTMLAPMLARAVDGTDFLQSRNGDGGCGGWRAQSARVWKRASATAQAVCRPWGIRSHTDAWTLVVAQAVDWTDFRQSRNGDGAAAAGAHSPRECWRGTARRRGQFADLGYPVSHRCLHPCWRGWSMGQIFDNRETVMGLRRLARTFRESVGERWRDGAGSLSTLGIDDPVTHRCLHTC